MIRRLATLDGDWHELESKALRKENERKEREARKAAAKEAAGNTTGSHAREPTKDRDRKRPNEGTESQRESKRVHTDSGSIPPSGSNAVHHQRPADGTAV